MKSASRHNGVRALARTPTLKIAQVCAVLFTCGAIGACTTPRYAHVSFDSEAPGSHVTNITNGHYLGMAPNHAVIKEVFAPFDGMEKTYTIQFRKKGYYDDAVILKINDWKRTQDEALSSPDLIEIFASPQRMPPCRRSAGEGGDND